MKARCRYSLQASGGCRDYVCLGDLNGDGLVEDTDFVAFASAYELLRCSDDSMEAGCPSDFNNDTPADDADFALFAQAHDVLACP